MYSKFTSPDIDRQPMTGSQDVMPSVAAYAALPGVVNARRRFANRVIDYVSAKFDLESEFDDIITIDVTDDVAEYLTIAKDPSAILAPTHLHNMIRHCCIAAPHLAVKFVSYDHDRRAVHFTFV